MLRECIRRMLAEDMGYGGDYAGLGFGDVAGGAPYGAHFGSGEDLYKIFVKPFVDVVQVTAGKTKEMSARTQSLVKVAFEALATTLAPWLGSDYNKIFEKEKQSIDKIRSEYADVYKATWDAFNNADILISAFAYRPDLFLTAALAKTAPKAVAKLLSVLSGGTLDKVIKQVLTGKKEKERRPGQAGDLDAFLGKMFGDKGNSRLSDGHLREEDTEGNVQEPTGLERLVTNDKVKELLANSPKVKQLEQVGQQVVQDTLRDVFGHAQDVLTAKSLTDLQTKLGKKIPGLDKLQQVPEQERAAAEQTLLTGVKKGMKELYTKSLEAQVQTAIKAGVPQDHPFVRDYMKVISKIKAL